MYVLAFEDDGFEFLFDPTRFYSPPAVYVRQGLHQAEVYLDDDVSLRHPGHFSEEALDRIVELVEQYQEELLDAWYSAREDYKRGRMDKRQTMVD